VSSSPERDDAGAVAVMTVILSIVLFAVAALAVDLGSAWASKRSAQSQVDLAALSAGDLLPATTSTQRTAVATRVAEYLNKVENQVRGQAAVTAVQLLDTDLTNGDAAMPADGTTLTVTAPLARVDFIFAGAAGLPTSTTVSAAATVGVYSQLPSSDVMPFYVPNGCAYGLLDSDTANGGTTAPVTPGTPGSGTGKAPVLFNATAQPDYATQYEQRTISFRVTGVGWLRATAPPVVQFEKRYDSSKRWAVTGAWTSTVGDQVWTFTATIGPQDVTALSGQWDYQVGAPGLFGGTYYSYEDNFNVQYSSAPPPVPSLPTCPTGTTDGSFGQLDSPRNPVVSDSKTNLAVNVAEGLDHQLTVRPGAVADECTNPPRTGEQLDSVSRAGNNCIRSDTLDDSTALANGLVRGAGGFTGRLNASRGSTRSGCHGGVNVSVAGVSINNDLLSCYMIGSTTALSSLTVAPTSTSTRLLDPAVVRSPRFVWIPEVYRTNRTSKNYQPIERFVPAFITDETRTSTRSLETATTDNGITCNASRASCLTVKTVTVFTFDPGWLPLDERSPVTTYDPALGRKTWRLTS